MNDQSPERLKALGKFQDPLITADGQERALVTLEAATTLWFNTGTLCNIECVNCYIESSPSNDALVYLSVTDVEKYLDQITLRNWPVREIGFTGGEPFMNPDMLAMTRHALERGFEVLILTNAMRPMMRPQIREGLRDLIETYRDKLTFRISIDHPDPDKNDAIRGAGSFAIALEGMQWLRDQNARMHVAGRTLWGESEATSRTGFAAFTPPMGLRLMRQIPAKPCYFLKWTKPPKFPRLQRLAGGSSTRNRGM